NINEAFHWIDINAEIKKKLIDDAQKAGRPPPFQQQGQANGMGATPTPAEKLTALVGDKSSLYFTTLSHQRVITDSRESDQAKVGYFLKDVKSVHDGNSVKALVRSESIILDGDVTKGG